MKIKLFFMDIDGTLTDGKIYMGDKGELIKAFNVKDGYGIKMLIRYGCVPVVITARNSEIVKRRCEELGITEIIQNCSDKKEKMMELAGKYGIKINESGILLGTSYIGDDIPDLECMKIAEYKGCPIDAVKEICDVSDYVSRKVGGEGAVRDYIEWLIQMCF